MVVDNIDLNRTSRNRKCIIYIANDTFDYQEISIWGKSKFSGKKDLEGSRRDINLNRCALQCKF